MWQRERSGFANDDAVAGVVGVSGPGKTTLVDALGSPPASGEREGARQGAVGEAVQRAAASEAPAQADPVAIAKQATAGAGGQLPYLDRVQSLFGQHDVSSIRAHQGGAAEQGAAQLGAHAFAVGDAVAFRGTPDLHTAAHEAAHVLQQRAGMHPAGGIDQPGDAHERQADRIADTVVAGRSVETLLDEIGGRGRAASGAAVQRQADAFITGLEAKLKAVPPDLAGFYGDIAGLHGSRAGDAALRTAFNSFVAAGRLTWRQAFRAVAFQEYGQLAAWPLQVTNFADGVDHGTYPIAALPPAGAVAIREYCVKSAGDLAEGPDLRARYRTDFNARFDSGRFAGWSTDLDLADFLAHEGIHAADHNANGGNSWDRYATEFRAYWVMGVGAGLSEAFDPTMSALGPKSQRARAIFTHLYGSSTYAFVKPDYDANTAEFRERVDNYLFPDGINLTLSAKLTELRNEIESYSGAAGAFAAKQTAIQAKYAACSPADKAEIKNNREWRILVEQKFPVPAERRQIKTALSIPP